MTREHILIIDDEAVVLNAAVDILTRSGYVITKAADGQEGLDSLKRGTFDLVITDLKMPDMDGMTLIGLIRTDISSDIPIVVMTGHGTIDIAIESMSLGTQGFIMKPFTPREFLDQVENALKKSAILKENLRLKAFLPLFEVNKRLLGEVHIERLLEIIVHEATRYTRAETASLLLSEEDGNLHMKASMGMEHEFLKTPIKVRMGDKIAGWVAENKEAVLLDNRVDLDHPLKDMMKRSEIRSALSVPIFCKGNVLGVMNLAKLSDQQPFTHSDMEMVTVLCGQAAIAIENAKLYEKLEGSFIAIIATLASTIEARDPYTAGHAIRMGEYSRAIAAEMGITDKKLETIHRAALLHDIGKIGIPDQILLKAGSLTSDENEIMKTHPDIGWKILENIAELSDVANIVRHHHSRFDGKGYPEDLKGEGIPLGARIIAVADTFEAMTSVRPYRKAVKASEAVDEIRGLQGKQFDPEVVEAFILVLRKKEII